MELEHTDSKYQNYIWDTQALNLLAKDVKAISMCQDAINYGHRYYITQVQTRELIGIPDRSMKYTDSSAWGKSENNTLEVLENLGFRRLSCVALGYLNFWILDGSMRLLESCGPRVDMFNDIYNGNNHHKRDATIAEATIYHNCILITNDKRLRNKINKHFPERAITYDYYLENCGAILIG